MKKYIYILYAVLTGVFASCSEGETGGENPQSNQTILKVTAADGLQTRAAATGVDRFAIEVYSDDAYTTAANVFADGTNKANNATGEFAMVLDRTQKYYCLLWADKSGSTVYNIADLKAVALTGKAAEAWHGTKEIAAGAEAALTATLNRAVSKISFMEIANLQAGTLTLNFDQPTTFNVATATTPGAATARPEETITIAADVDGSTTPVKLNTTDVFVLSPVATANLTDLTLKYGEEDAFTVPQAPMKANFNTNIKGHYTKAKDNPTFTVTCDDEWEMPDNEVVYYKVGDYYPAGSTKENAVGVVYWVDPANAAKGKIVSMDEAFLAWYINDDEIDVVATSETDGTANTHTITNISGYETKYPAIAWCVAKNTSAPSGISWYLPAIDELETLYNIWIADAIGFNSKLADAIEGDGNDAYCSSTQEGGEYVHIGYFDTGEIYLDYDPNNYSYKVRAISAF